MRVLKSLVLAATMLAGSSFAAGAEVNVVASIKPVHSLVAAVMDGAGTPGLIIDGAGSPHNYALKPSQAKMLENADVVFWIGHELEAFLEKPLETVAAKATAVELIDAHELIKLGFREGGAFEKHSDDDHDDHEHEAKADDNHDHHEEAEAHHGHGEFDAHVWLDPQNAKAMVHEIEETLVKADPANAEKYKDNAQAVTAKLDRLITEITATLEPVKHKGFIVFHDAYQYFENRFGVMAAGSVTVSPEVMPGAERVTEIHAKVQELGAACVFAEPQFEPKLVATVTEGTPARSGIIDPLGSALENGPELYFSMIRNMAQSIKACLSEAS
jgi:zinc transport system substrate-binding protein